MSTTATFKTLDSLSSELQEMGHHSAEYWDKQVHVVPKSKTIDRTAYLVQMVKDKVVLHIGCTGPLDVALRKSAKRCYGTDQQALSRPDFTLCNLDELRDAWSVENPLHSPLPVFPDVELIVCGEVLEHLSNPGYFLDFLQMAYPTQLVIFTVPNAMCTGGIEWLMKRGRENVNRDHVCYYSYVTLKTLLLRHGYTLTQHFWYGGLPYVAEGLIAVASPSKD